MNEKMTKKYAIIDKETGEIQELIPYNPNQVLVHKNSVEAFKQKKAMEELKENVKGKSWIACYHEPIRHAAKIMTLFECGTVLKLLMYINFKDQGLLVKDGKPMKMKDIQKVIRKGETQTRAILRRLEELHIVKKEKSGRSNVYMISADYHTMGEILEKVSFTKLYKGKARELLEKIDLNQAGILYKILPYFHYYKCYLCMNPDEEDETKIHFLSQEELAELIAIDPDTVSKHMKALKDQMVIMDARAGKVVNYYVHPDLMFRMQHDNQHTLAIRKIFEDLDINRKNQQKR